MAATATIARPPSSGSNGALSARTSPVASRPKTMIGKSMSAASPGSSPKPTNTHHIALSLGSGQARGLPTPPPTPPQGHAPFLPPSAAATGTVGGVLLLDGGTLRMDESLRLPLWALLRHPRATAQLSAFVRREHSEENLEFVQEVERFRQWATRLDALDPKWEAKWDQRRHNNYQQQREAKEARLQQLQQQHNGGHHGNDEKYVLPSSGLGSEKKRRSSIHHTKVNNTNNSSNSNSSNSSGSNNGSGNSNTNNSNGANNTPASIAAINGVDRRDTFEHKQPSIASANATIPHIPVLPLPVLGPSPSNGNGNSGNVAPATTNNPNYNNVSGSIATLHLNEDGTPRGGIRTNLDRHDSPNGPSINPNVLFSPPPGSNNNNGGTSPNGTDGTPPIRRERIRLRGERHQRGDSRNGSPQNPNPLAGGDGNGALPSNDSPSSPSTPDEVRGARSSSHSHKFPRKLLPPLAHLSRNENRMSVDAAAISQLKAQHQAAVEAAATAAPVNNRRGQSGPFRFPHPISAYSGAAGASTTSGSNNSGNSNGNGTLPPPQMIAAGHAAHASLVSSTPSPLMGPFLPSSTSTSSSSSSAVTNTNDATSTCAIFATAAATPLPDLALATCAVDPQTTSVSVSTSSTTSTIAPALARTGSSTNPSLRATITSLDVIHERGRSNSLTALPQAHSHDSDDGHGHGHVGASTSASLSSSPAVAASAASVIGNSNSSGVNTTPPHGNNVPVAHAPLVPSISSPSALLRRVSAKHLTSNGTGHAPSLSGGNSSASNGHTSIATHAHFPSNSTVAHTTTTIVPSSSSSSTALPTSVPPLYTAMSHSGGGVSASSSLSTSSNAPSASTSVSATSGNNRTANFVPHYIGTANTNASGQPHTPTHQHTTTSNGARPPSSLSRRRLFSPPSPANAIQGSLGGSQISAHAPQSTTVVTFGPPPTVGIHATPANAASQQSDAPPTIWGQVPYKPTPGSSHGNRVGVGIGVGVGTATTQTLPAPLPLPPSSTTNAGGSSRPHTPVLPIPPLLPALSPMSLVNPLTSRLPVGSSISPSFAALPGGQFTFGSASIGNGNHSNGNGNAMGNGTGSMKGMSTHTPIYVNHTPRVRPEEELVTRAIADEANRIWSKFCPDAPMAISWPPRTIRAFKTELAECGRVESPFVFNEAQQQELDSLKNDILPRFYQSKEYRTLTSDLLTELAVKINAFERWQTGSEVPVTAQVEVTPPSSPSLPRSPAAPGGSSRPGTAGAFPVAVTRLPLPSTIPHQVHIHTPHPTPPFGAMPTPSIALPPGTASGGLDSQRITLPTISITAPTPPPPRPPQPPPHTMSHLNTGPGALSVTLPPLAPISPDPSSTNNLLYSPPMSIVRGLQPVDTDLASTSLLGNSPLAAAVDAYNAQQAAANNRSPIQNHLLLSTSSTVDPLSSIYNAATAALLNSPSPVIPVRHLPNMVVTTPMGEAAQNHHGGFTTARGTMHISTTPSAGSVPSRTMPADDQPSPSADTIAANLLLPTPVGATSVVSLPPPTVLIPSTSVASVAGDIQLPPPSLTPISFPTAPSTPMTPATVAAVASSSSSSSSSTPLDQRHNGLPSSPPSLSESRHNSDSSNPTNGNHSDEKGGSPSSGGVNATATATVVTPTTGVHHAVDAAMAAAIAVGGSATMTSSIAGSSDIHPPHHMPTLVTNTSAISQNHSSYNPTSVSHINHHNNAPPSPPQVNGSSHSVNGNGTASGSTTPTPPAQRRLNPLGGAAHAALRRQHSHSHGGNGASVGIDHQGRATYFFPTDYDPPSRLTKSQTDTGPLYMNGGSSHSLGNSNHNNMVNTNRLSGFLMSTETKTMMTTTGGASGNGSNSPLPSSSLTLPFTASLSMSRVQPLPLPLPSSSHTTPTMSSALATVVASSTFLQTGALSPSTNASSPVTPIPPSLMAHTPGGSVLPAQPSLFVFRRTKNEDADRLKFSFQCFFDNPLGLQAIGAFMRAEYSVDNLDFVIAVDDFKSRILDRDEMGREARRIYSVFLEAKSQHEVTYPAKLKTALLKQLDAPHKEMFAAIYESVLATCRVDVFPRFVKSKLYRAIIDDLKARLVELVAKRRRQREEQKAATPVNISTDAHIKFTRQQTMRATAGQSAAAIAAAKKKARNQQISFDEVLLDPEYLQAYITFCTREHSEENILFWCAAHGYTRAAQDGATVEQLRSTAVHIFDLYLRAGSAFEILIDTHFKRHIIESMDQRRIDGTLFIAAQKQVLDLMKKDSGVRFLKCDEYLAVLKKRRNDNHGILCATCW